MPSTLILLNYCLFHKNMLQCHLVIKMEVLRFIFAVFALIGAADKIFGSKLKLGSEFEKGIMAAGTLALSMVGMLCIAPVLADGLTVVFAPVAEFLHIDLSFLGAFIANDMGGAAISKELAGDAAIGGFNGLVVASMMGATICFTVPVSLKMIKKEHHKQVLLGILCGIATMPLGCIVSGLMLKISFGTLLINLLPVILVAIITCVGLILKPQLCSKIFAGIGWAVSAVIAVGLAAAIFEHITKIALIPGMMPAMDAFLIVCDIAVILAGVFPLIAVISKLFSKPFAAIGKKAGINETSVLGLISSLANNIPTFDMAEKMDSKGRVINMAFAVSASFVFGDHLAFTMAFDENFLPAMIVGKLISGIAAIIVAGFAAKKIKD